MQAKFLIYLLPITLLFSGCAKELPQIEPGKYMITEGDFVRLRAANRLIDKMCHNDMEWQKGLKELFDLFPGLEINPKYVFECIAKNSWSYEPYIRRTDVIRMEETPYYPWAESEESAEAKAGKQREECQKENGTDSAECFFIISQRKYLLDEYEIHKYPPECTEDSMSEIKDYSRDILRAVRLKSNTLSAKKDLALFLRLMRKTSGRTIFNEEDFKRVLETDWGSEENNKQAATIDYRPYLKLEDNWVSVCVLKHYDMRDLLTQDCITAYIHGEEICRRETLSGETYFDMDRRNYVI